MRTFAFSSSFRGQVPESDLQLTDVGVPEFIFCYPGDEGPRWKFSAYCTVLVVHSLAEAIGIIESYKDRQDVEKDSATG
jgi:hypothetical protein